MASRFWSNLARTVPLHCRRHIKKTLVPGGSAGSVRVQAYSDAGSGENPGAEYPIPVYTPRQNESLQDMRARLLYQSRKRGMLENGILLSTFASKYLGMLTEGQIKQYDLLINVPSNDWDIFYWMVKKQPVPEQYDNEVMRMLQEHAANKGSEERFTQPPL